jgi:hypothetical protein
MLELTLNQQFDYRVISDSATRLSNEQLLEQLKQAHHLLKQKSFILDNFLTNSSLEIKFIDKSDPTYSFNQHLIFLEFEKYDREKLIDVLLGTIKTLMYTENHIKSVLIG